MNQVAASKQGLANSQSNKLQAEDQSVHNWYRFVLSFPPHLVRTYLTQFGMNNSHCVLDPFCGTGTVLVECKKLGIPCIGIEANPMAHFASQVKLDWTADPKHLLEHARHIAEKATNLLNQNGIEDNPIFEDIRIEHQQLRTLSEEEAKLLLTDSISPLPLHKTLILLECLKENHEEQYYKYERLALAKALVDSIGNLRFGPEVGIGPIKADTPVISAWLNRVQVIANDLLALRQMTDVPAKIFYDDARRVEYILEPDSIDAVITSPPYPNEKDYTRTTRLESVLLGFIHNKGDLRSLKKGLLRSNTRNVYQGDNDDEWIVNHQEIQEIANTIEARRIELGKTSGFEKLYARVTRLYFGGIARHLSALRTVLRPGAQLAYVVGDQASYLRIMIPTGKLIAEIAVSLGYELVSIDLFRTRFATATKAQLREEVVVLRWPRNPVISKIDTQQREYQTSNSYPVTASAIADKNTTSNSNNKDDVNILFPLIEKDVTEDKAINSPGDISHRRHTMSGLFPEFASNEDREETPSITKKLNRYQKLMEHIFFSGYKEGIQKVEFARADIEKAAQELDIKLPKNLGDIIYSFRYRAILPLSIRDKAPEGKEWIIRPSGRSLYHFVATNMLHIIPNEMMSETKVPDATPGIVSMYALGDEQALLSKLRYNRLIDIFTGITCYSLQNHLRTTIVGMGQVETDEIYVGIDRRGAQYVIPLQAKGGNDKIGIVQIEQDMALCAEKFPLLICRPIAAQFIGEGRIALFEFEESDEGLKLHREHHYKLVPSDNMTEEDLRSYRNRSLE